MKLLFNKLPDSCLSLDESWEPIDANKDVKLIKLVPIVISIIILYNLFFSWVGIGLKGSLVIYFVTGLITIPLHELIHALTFPGKKLSENTLFGFSLKKSICYSYFNGQLSKSRYIWVSVMPVIILSVIPLILFMLTGLSSSTIARVSYINALVSSIDIYMVLYISFKVPDKSIIINSGLVIYWKKLK